MFEGLILILLASLGFSIIAVILSVYALTHKRKKEKGPVANKQIGFK